MRRPRPLSRLRDRRRRRAAPRGPFAPPTPPESQPESWYEDDESAPFAEEARPPSAPGEGAPAETGTPPDPHAASETPPDRPAPSAAAPDPPSARKTAPAAGEPPPDPNAASETPPTVGESPSDPRAASETPPDPPTPDETPPTPDETARTPSETSPAGEVQAAPHETARPAPAASLSLAARRALAAALRGVTSSRRSVLLRFLPAACLAIVVVVLGAYLLLRDGGGSTRAPTVAGSRFGAQPSGGQRKGSLLDAFAPVLEPSSGGSVPSTPATHLNVALPVGRAVAQLFVVGFAGADSHVPILARLRERDWGGVVVGAANYRSSKQMRRLVARIAAAARAAHHTPPLLGARQAGGVASAFAGRAPAPEPQLGADGHPAAAQEQAIQAARVLRALHLNMDLAPDADLGYQGTAAAGRAFSADPALTTRLTLAALRGYRASGVIPVLGHFPGEGAASTDPQQSAASVGVSMSDLRTRDIKPFAAALGDAPIMQMSDAVFAALDAGQPATLSPAAIGLLRDGLHYRGLVMSGDLSAVTAATGGNVGQAAVSALQAGADLLYLSGGTTDSEAAYSAVLLALRQGQLSARQLALAVARILALKRAYGLLG